MTQTWAVRWNGTSKVLRKVGRADTYLDGTLVDPDSDTSTPPPPPPPPPPVVSLFAGHVPNRVLVGFSAPDDDNAQWAFPGWSGVRAHVGRDVYVHRTFTPSTNPSIWVSWVNGAHLDNYTKQTTGTGMLPLMSVKCSDWAACAAGEFDAAWAQIRTNAKAWRTSGPGGTPRPGSLTFDHEPDGNPGGTLAQWGITQAIMSNFFAGWSSNRTTGAKIAGSYVAANDVSDILSWHCIPNGHWWGPKNLQQVKIDAACPPILIQNFRENRGPIAPDVYDPSPSNKDNANDPLRDTLPFDYALNADRTHKKITAIIAWARANGVASLGCGEFSATEATEIQRCWKVMRENRDIWTFASHFSSPQNSRWPWRVIPKAYPGGQHPDVYKTAGVLSLRDFGGSDMSAARLAALQVMIDESVSPAYTGALV